MTTKPNIANSIINYYFIIIIITDVYYEAKKLNFNYEFLLYTIGRYPLHQLSNMSG